MLTSSKSWIAGTAIAVAAALPFTHADATVLLTFGQTSTGPTITATNPTSTTTSISGSNVAVSITQFLGGGAPISAYLNLSLNSQGTATQTSLPGGLTEDTQTYSGTATFTSGLNGTGTDYLTATFTDTVFGLDGASSLTLSASQPPQTVSFTSSVLPPSDFVYPESISFSFADVTPPSALTNGTLAAFTSSVSGTSSTSIGTAIPEAGALALLAIGVLSVGGIRRRAA